MAKAKRRKPLSDLVPTNWLDPLLSGPGSVLASKRAGAWNCRDIEALFFLCQSAILLAWLLA